MPFAAAQTIDFKKVPEFGFLFVVLFAFRVRRRANQEERNLCRNMFALPANEKSPPAATKRMIVYLLLMKFCFGGLVMLYMLCMLILLLLLRMLLSNFFLNR